MAVKAESFLVLDTSLAGRISRAWVREVQPKLDQIIELAEDGDFAEAREQANRLEMTGVVSRNRRFMELVGMSAILFGASDITPPERSDIASRGRPDVLAKATENFIMFIEIGLADAVRKELMKAISEEESEQLAARDRSAKSQTVQKASRIRSLVSGTSTGPKALLQQRAMIGASLHTSRLAQWGFLVEADAKGIVEYEVNEELDDRTCPVCETMNGTVFTVEQALERLERMITIDDPEELKEMAPFPSQSAAAVEELRDMSTAELQARGLDTPPYHPLCRGRVVRTTNPTVVVGAQSATQVSGPEGGRQPPASQPRRTPQQVYQDLEDRMTMRVTDDEFDGVNFYIDAGDTAINAPLRKGQKVSRSAFDSAKALDGVIGRAESTLPQNVTLYRGVVDTDAVVGGRAGLKVGSIFRDRGYMSTSTSREQALIFAEGAKLEQKPALMEIFAAKGKKAFYVGNVDDAEMELIFGRGTGLRVTEIIEDGVEVFNSQAKVIRGDLIKVEVL